MEDGRTSTPYRSGWPHPLTNAVAGATMEDTLRTSTEYLAAGIGQYWIVDRAHRTLAVLAVGSGGWDVLRDLDDQRPTGSVAVGAEASHGTVELDLDDLLAV